MLGYTVWLGMFSLEAKVLEFFGFVKNIPYINGSNTSFVNGFANLLLHMIGQTHW